MKKRTGSLGIQILHNLRDQVLKELKTLGAYQYYSAASGSQYVKFKDPRLGSVRIGDHRGKEKYRYKWNLIAGGIRRSFWDGNCLRYYFPIDELDEMCEQITAFRRQLLQNYGEYDVNKDLFAGKRKLQERR